MKYIVQKFGGTSLGNADRMLNVAKIIQNTLKNNQIIVVVSAMSSYIKSEGSTSLLLKALDQAVNRQDFNETVDLIEKNHIKIVQNAIPDSKMNQKLQNQILDELQKLRTFLGALKIIEEASSRSQDAVISVGEKLSALIFSAILSSQGLPAKFVNLDDIVKQKFINVDQSFYQYLRKQVVQAVLECGNKIPVVTGFLGPIPGGIINTIGRGYTDFTASLIAAGLQAEEFQIWKEVDGVYTADPRKVPNATVLEKISPEEAAELTYYGAEVIHPFTMEQAITAKVPIRVKNTFKPALPGTIINPNDHEIYHKSKPIAVTVKRDITVLNIYLNRRYVEHGFLSKVFNIFDKHEISINLIATSEANVSMTLETHKENIARAVIDLNKLGETIIFENMAIISLIGKGMSSSVGIASKMFSTIANEKINIKIISQGISEINISCVIEEKDADQALIAVHKAMLE